MIWTYAWILRRELLIRIATLAPGVTQLETSLKGTPDVPQSQHRLIRPAALNLDVTNKGTYCGVTTVHVNMET